VKQWVSPLSCRFTTHSHHPNFAHPPVVSSSTTRIRKRPPMTLKSTSSEPGVQGSEGVNSSSPYNIPETGPADESVGSKSMPYPPHASPEETVVDWMQSQPYTMPGTFPEPDINVTSDKHTQSGPHQTASDTKTDFLALSPKTHEGGTAASTRTPWTVETSSATKYQESGYSNWWGYPSWTSTTKREHDPGLPNTEDVSQPPQEAHSRSMPGVHSTTSVHPLVLPRTEEPTLRERARSAWEYVKTAPREYLTNTIDGTIEDCTSRAKSRLREDLSALKSAMGTGAQIGLAVTLGCLALNVGASAVINVCDAIDTVKGNRWRRSAWDEWSRAHSAGVWPSPYTTETAGHMGSMEEWKV
jgi:hypothetical protein